MDPAREKTDSPGGTAPPEPHEELARPRTPEERRAWIKQAALVLLLSWIVAGLLFLLFATPIRPE
jgi:hypothetical protein